MRVVRRVRPPTPHERLLLTKRKFAKRIWHRQRRNILTRLKGKGILSVGRRRFLGKKFGGDLRFHVVTLVFPHVFEMALATCLPSCCFSRLLIDCCAGPSGLWGLPGLCRSLVLRCSVQTSSQKQTYKPVTVFSDAVSYLS